MLVENVCTTLRSSKKKKKRQGLLARNKGTSPTVWLLLPHSTDQKRG